MMIDTNVEPVKLVAQIGSAHASNNTVEAGSLLGLIREVYRVLADLKGGASEPVMVEKLVPAVPRKKSVYPDYIVCLEDGMKLKMLRRHLRAAFRMTPEQYRERWGLPVDYPMTVPSYAEHRSGLAKKLGLGRKVATRNRPARHGARKQRSDDAPRGCEAAMELLHGARWVMDRSYPAIRDKPA